MYLVFRVNGEGHLESSLQRRHLRHLVEDEGASFQGLDVDEGVADHAEGRTTNRLAVNWILMARGGVGLLKESGLMCKLCR